MLACLVSKKTNEPVARDNVIVQGRRVRFIVRTSNRARSLAPIDGEVDCVDISGRHCVAHGELFFGPTATGNVGEVHCAQAPGDRPPQVCPSSRRNDWKEGEVDCADGATRMGEKV